MRKLSRTIIHRLIAETRGAEIAEAAAVLPLMFMVLLGIFWFGQAFSIYGAITRAAQEGARAGSAPTCATCTAGALPPISAANAVQAALQASKLDPTQAQYPATPPTFNSCDPNSPGPITCDGSSTNFCIQTPVQLTTLGTGATNVCGISVSLQYPFRFWLPFTSINKQTIFITTAASVRLENR